MINSIDLSPSILRTNILEMAKIGNSVHIGCAFSLVEILSVLYQKTLKYNHNDPLDPSNDRVILSKGHGAMALYSCFKELSWIDEVHFKNYFSDGSLLYGLGESSVPGIEVCGGSLGHGLPIASGMALGYKKQQTNQKLFCIMGDGEINEGTVWESLLFIAHNNLNNLVTIIDANGFQAMGKTSKIMHLEPLAKKFESFGHNVIECDGHNMLELENAFNKSIDTDRPLAIIARTTKGKGVSFMENENMWHYIRLTDEQYKMAMDEVSQKG